jgi:hypothetical protein
VVVLGALIRRSRRRNDELTGRPVRRWLVLSGRGAVTTRARRGGEAD